MMGYDLMVELVDHIRRLVRRILHGLRHLAFPTWTERQQ
jgi:hypothetical protein